MFRKNYKWIDDYIKSNEEEGRTLNSGAFRLLKKELETKENIIEKLRYELKKYKSPTKKEKV